MRSLVIYLIGINVLTFLIYGIDKWKARRGEWRIPRKLHQAHSNLSFPAPASK